MQPANIIHQTQSQSFQQQVQKLQAGQIIHGKVNKIFPNQTAEVQIGSQKLIASLDAPLKTGERYWLQVQPGEGRLHLKVLNNGAGKNESNGLKGAAEQLLAHLTVPKNKETTELAKFLLTNQLPITRQTFDMSVQWLKTSENFTASLGIIKTMHAMNLPFIDDVYSALQSLENDGTFYSSITKLLEQINLKGTRSEALHTVKSLLEKMAAPGQFHIAAGDRPVDFTRGPSVAGFVKELAKMLGVNMEHFLASVGGMESGAPNEELFTLKPMLMKLLAENQHPSIKEGAEQILNRITAQQILSQETGPLQNIFMQIPLALSRLQTDLTIQWSGRKKGDGTIDPNYCRVLFYLDLEQMQQTVIDVQIQNRVMKITVINDNHEMLEQLSRPLMPGLKNNIEKMNYRLSSVVFESEASRNEKRTVRTAAQNPAAIAGSKPYNGVDIRI